VNITPLCPRCGNAIHDDKSEFCNRCGASVKKEPEQKLPVCNRCGKPAPDDEALFCNRCGTEYKTEPVNITPLCPRCGYQIPDDQSAFCNRCGATIGTEPVNKKPVCLKCGAPALDEETLFCNRCGTQFNHHVSNKKPVHSPVHKSSQPVSVKISQKKQVPAVVVPLDLLDPVSDEEFEEVHYPHSFSPPVKSSQKKYAHLPLVAEELAGGKGKDASIVIPGNSKKYAHLPLIADEFKEKQSPRLEIESPYIPAPPKEKRDGRSKKGLFDMLKK
jgi:predicted amidophosphoribosyltransferase